MSADQFAQGMMVSTEVLKAIARMAHEDSGKAGIDITINVHYDGGPKVDVQVGLGSTPRHKTVVALEKELGLREDI